MLPQPGPKLIGPGNLMSVPGKGFMSGRRSLTATLTASAGMVWFDLKASDVLATCILINRDNL